MGDNFTLVCDVTGAENLNPITTYQWMKNSGTEITVGDNTNTLSFSVLTLSDASNYTCVISVNSSYLTEPITRTSNTFHLSLEGKCVHFYRFLCKINVTHNDSWNPFSAD